MAKGNDPPRLTIRITHEQRKALTDLIPWGMQDAILNILIDDLITVMFKASREGQLKMLTSALITKSIALDEVGPNFIKLKKDAGVPD